MTAAAAAAATTTTTTMAKSFRFSVCKKDRENGRGKKQQSIPSEVSSCRGPSWRKNTALTRARSLRSCRASVVPSLLVAVGSKWPGPHVCLPSTRLMKQRFVVDDGAAQRRAKPWTWFGGVVKDDGLEEEAWRCGAG